MPAPTCPADEAQRLAALLLLEIDAQRSPTFDVYPYLASKLFDTPIAAISIIEQDRQWFKASVGLDITQTPRDAAFCAYAILEPGEILYVPDATKDPRFADNPLVVGEFGLRFYAGCPVMGPSGLPVGAVCVIDRKPRTVTPTELEQLRHLAVGVGSALRLHVSVRQLEQQVNTDALTGLLNRAGFLHRLEAALGARRDRDGDAAALGVMFLDLDRFKSINDLFGHGGGDAALREVAQRLRSVSRHTDALCRFGGDEFCILLQDMAHNELVQFAQRIHAAFEQPFTINDQIVPLRTSIGIALSHEARITADELIFGSDKALYAAKRAGRSTTRFASHDGQAPDGFEPGRMMNQQRLRASLIPAGHEPFVLALQPLFDGQTAELTGFEALVRWPQPDGTMLPPDAFIPAAEATGLIVELDRWVLNEACRLAAAWPEHLTVSSNVSAANFLAAGLVETVTSTLAAHGLPADRLKLEITESALLHDTAGVQAILAQLRKLGVRVILDDFGSGHASIAYLRDFPFDGLKIDRSLTANLETDARSGALVDAIIDMGRALGIEVTAEGVETPGQLSRVRKGGVTTVQGYLLGRPMTPKAARELIADATAALA